MFDEFVRPELQSMCRALPHSMYHLDGVGQLNKLDSLLKIDELDGVQWIPGDGKPDPSHWPEVFHKIAAANKNIQVLGDFDCLDTVVEQTGMPGRIHSCIWQAAPDEKEARKRIEKYMG